jgi:hypothetical protein
MASAQAYTGYYYLQLSSGHQKIQQAAAVRLLSPGAGHFPGSLFFFNPLYKVDRVFTIIFENF